MPSSPLVDLATARKARRLRAEGLSIAAVCERLGVGRNALSAALSRLAAVEDAKADLANQVAA